KLERGAGDLLTTCGISADACGLQTAPNPHKGKTLETGEIRVSIRRRVDYHAAPSPAGDDADMQVRNKQDFWAGIMFAVIGAFAALGSLRYSMGTARDMGPGYFPFWLGICLGVLGAIVALRSVSASAPISKLDPADWKTVAL